VVSLYKRVVGESLVNGQTANNQSGPHVARLPNGGFVVVWTDGSTVGDPDFGIRAQRYDAAGAKVGSEFLVNTTTAGTQSAARVTALPSGRFVITWTDQSATGGDTSSTAVRGQLYEANGTALGGEFLVNTTVTGAQSAPTVAGLTAGGFLIAWVDSSGQGGDASGSAIKGQLFDANGVKVGAEFLGNTTTQNSQSSPSVIALAGGGFVIGWNETFSSGGSIVGAERVQIFDSAAAKVGPELLVNSSSDGNLINTNLTALPTGFLVTWAQQDSAPFPGVPITLDVRGQLYDTLGNKVGAEFVVNSTTEGSQSTPSAAALPGGGFIITWQGPGEGISGANVYGRIYDSAGARVGVEFILSSIAEGSQGFPRVDVLASGDIVVTWQDNSGIGGDSSGIAVKAEILTLSSDAPSDIALSAAAISETAREDVGLFTLSTTGALNSSFTYELLSDSSGGAFRIEGNKLVVDDHSLLDFETAPTVQLQIRSTDLNGNSFTETLAVSIADTPESAVAGGDQFLVNTTSSGNQTESTVTLLASGGFVVNWYDWNLGGRAQVYDSDGNKIGSELGLAGPLAALPGGGFVAAIQATGGDGSYGGIAIRLYDALGNPIGGEITVNSTTVGDQWVDSVAVLESGGFVVTWTDRPPGFLPNTFNPTDVRGQRFDASGAKVGAEFLVNTSTAEDQLQSQVAALQSGGFVITWLDGFYGGLRGQMYDSNGARVGLDFRIETSSPAPAEQQIVGLSGGGFVVVWSKNFSSGGFTGVGDLTAQIFDAQGIRIGTEILITNSGPGQVQSFDVDSLAWGGFVVTWSSDLEQIRAQQFDATGGRVGDELAVNQVGSNLIQASVSGLDSGGFLVAWTDRAADGSGAGVQARLFEPVSTISGTGAADVLNGTPGADHMFGEGGNDILNGLAGNDLLDGGAGDDALNGSGGNDIYVVDSAGDVVTENAGEGTDEVRTGLASYQLGANVEKLSGTSGAGQSLTGNALDNIIAGGAGADTMTGGAGNDRYIVGAGDSVVETAGEGTDEIDTALAAYTLGANIENLVGTSGSGQTLTGNAANNMITGGSGNDVIDGGGGNDTMNGGLGNDLYFVDSASDTVIETGAGIDEVRTSLASYTLGAGVENLTGTSPLGQILAGNLGGNVITGGSGDDTITGDGGDTLIGGLGNDIYIVPQPGTIIENASEGIDEIRTSFSQWTLADNFENLTGTSAVFQALHGNAASNVVRAGTGGADLFGEGGDDTLIGSAANEQLFGGEGADLMTGGGGNDFYVLVGAGDVVVEEAGGGSDWVTTSLASYVLADNVETLEGTASAAQALTGNAEANRIIGSNYNDVLDGGAGDDTLEGGFGDDVYIVDSLGDVVTDFFGDNDEVRTGLSTYTLAANIERLTGTSAAGQTLTGNALGNVITGGSGNDMLDGAAGSDTLSGGFGNDIYVVDAGDSVTEVADQGLDEVRTNLSSYSLAANVENLTGGAADQTLTGNGFNNVIDGGAGADAMAGGGGHDVYIVDNLGDTVTELDGAGTDEVRTSLGSKTAPDYALYVLPNYVENLTGTSAGAQGVRGNSLDNVIVMAGGADLIVLDDGGVDNINAGGGNDYIYYGAALTAADVTNGGAGTDTVGLLGNYAGLVFTATNLVGVERLALYTGGGTNSYNVTTNDANVAAGTEFFVTAASLNAAEVLTFNGSAETNGRFTVLGGGGADTIVGGAGNDYVAGNGGNDTLYGLGGSDTLFGGAGADQLRGGAGQDFFRYQATSDSMTGSVDQILDFTGADRIDLSAIDAKTGGGNDAFTFIGASAFHNVAGELRAYQSGPNWFVEGDVNGDGVADLLIQVNIADASPLGAGNFIL
jgi:Ca2+-binding RTX toxin-like protein